FPPRAFTLVEISPRPIKRRRDDRVADALARALVAIGFCEIRAAKSPHRVPRRGDIVGVNQLDALAMRETMVLGVEVAPLIKLRLRSLIIAPRALAFLMGQCKIEQLELAGDVSALPVSVDGDFASVDPRGQIARGVIFNPNRLFFSRRD